jgi:hypothetical protein
MEVLPSRLTEIVHELVLQIDRLVMDRCGGRVIPPFAGQVIY